MVLAADAHVARTALHEEASVPVGPGSSQGGNDSGVREMEVLTTCA